MPIKLVNDLRCPWKHLKAINISCLSFKVLVFKQLKEVIYQLLKVMKQGFTDVGENNDLVVRTLNRELWDTTLSPNFPRTLYMTSASNFTPCFYASVKMGNSVLSLRNCYEQACPKQYDTGLAL